MSDMDFAVNIGGGLYMDSNGVLHQTAPQGVPVYDAPFGLPVDPDKVKNALTGIQKFVADATDANNKAKFVNEFGVPLQLFDILSAIGKVAGIVAPAIAAVAILYDVLRITGILKSGSGPSELELLIKEYMEQLGGLVHGLATVIDQQNLAGGRNDMAAFLATLDDHIILLKNTNPNVTQLENDRNLLHLLHGQKEDGVYKLLDASTWLAPFDRSEHTMVWPYVPAMHVMPAGVPGTPPTPAAMPPEGAPRFDHRLMVPLASYAAEAYLVCIRGIEPEYRTTGNFRANLRNFALRIDALARNMRDHLLGRTIYKPSDFSMYTLNSWEVIDPFPTLLPEDQITISPKCTRWPVGAMDLRYHNNGYFGQFLQNLWNNEWVGTPHATKHGGMDFRWIPPARLTRSPWNNGTVEGDYLYTITNPDECAAAANEQSERDYANLLLTSGYSNLLYLGALFRNEATEPSKSQTVRGDALLLRDTKPAVPVTVESEPIFMSGVVTSPASRRLQECVGIIDIHTQPIKRARPVEYTVKLRTLSSIRKTHSYEPRNRWHEATYEDYQWAKYEHDGNNPSFLKLAVTHLAGVAVAEHQLIAGSSPREPKHVPRTEIELKAHTFDWWVPVKPPFQLGTDPAVTRAALRSVGWTESHPPKKTHNGTGAAQTLSYDGAGIFAPILDLSPAMFREDGAQDWEGEHREVAEATVKIAYTLDWNADRLYIRLESRPSDRNYVVFVVVEEKMSGSENVLHTAVPVPVNGQVTYVPQQFFDNEREAIEKAGRVIKDFNDKYSKSVVIGPEDPVIGWVRPGDFVGSAGLERMAALAQQHQPELLSRVMAEHATADLAKSAP